jgi:FixJ family two-component response regulator
VTTIPNGKQFTVIVIDDDELIRYTMRKKLSRFGYRVISMDKGEDALYLIKNKVEPVDFVVTDINLRKMDGIELLRHISALENPIPVLLIGQGNVEDAIKALRYGACDFIKKPVDVNQLASKIRTVLKVREEEKRVVSLGKYCMKEKKTLSIPSEPELGNLISFELTKNLVGIGICNNVTAENISMSLREAISNAMYHGNLEVSSDIRQSNHGNKEFNDIVSTRAKEEPYKNRRIHIEYELTSDYVEYIIEDEGPGFDYTKLPDPNDPVNFFKKSGRGILIIKIHMDEVEWNSKGNQLRLRKYKVSSE